MFNAYVLELKWYLAGISSFLAVNILVRDSSSNQSFLVGEDSRFGAASASYASTIHLIYVNQRLCVPMCPLMHDGSDCWSNPFCIMDNAVRDSVKCPDCGYMYHSLCVGTRPHGVCGCSQLVAIAEGYVLSNVGISGPMVLLI